MPTDFVSLLLYALPLALIFIAYARKRHRDHAVSAITLQESAEAGLLDAPSLHPVIDTKTCIGCGSCVAACPEMPAHQVLGMVRRKATLVSPTDCIGHGACRTACPVDAITLVFGSERRGVDIPHVAPNFETNVPGIFIAGELGGMGLIRNAIEQGRQAVDSIVAQLRERGQGKSGYLDVMIVGAGPSGIAASLAAKSHKLTFVTVEQEALGGTVASFPRRKLVMTAPATLPIVGKMKFTDTTKETLLRFWEEVVSRTQLKINTGERLEEIKKRDDHFEVRTASDCYRTRTVLLAIGRRGTPRKLGVPGEEQSKVVYKLMDPEQYRDSHVLIVGGGDSALESAITIGEQEGATVTLSYRSEAFSRAKKKNRTRLEEAEQRGQVRVLLESNVKRIDEKTVEIEQRGETLTIPNDIVIVNAGGILPTGFLKELGVEVHTKRGTQ